MLLALCLLPFVPVAPQVASESSLLALVPDDAYVLVHGRDFGGLRARAERNDWYRLLGSAHGEPLLEGLAGELRRETDSELDQLLAIGRELQGEVVFFDTASVAGFVAAPPTRRAALADLMRAWLPAGEAAEGTFEVAGGKVQLVAWPAGPVPSQEPDERLESDDSGDLDELDELGYLDDPSANYPRAGHYAAFVDHPGVLALYSGDDSAAVLAALTEGLTRLTAGPGARPAQVVASYLAAGGGRADGLELFVDFTPFVAEAEQALQRSLDGLLPDPSRLLGLERGTWLHASVDVYPGTPVDCRARLHLPADTLAAQLADTFKPLPNTLPADLQKGVFALWALNWDLKLFYQRVRAAYAAAGLEKDLEALDSGLQMAKALADVDPIEDVLNQLAGDFAVYFVEPTGALPESPSDREEVFSWLGIQMGLVGADAFTTAFENLIGMGGLDSVFDEVEIAGVDAYVASDADGFDGGVAILPSTFTVGVSRRVLTGSLRALTRVEGASLDGSRLQGVLDENAGVCFLSCLELTPVRRYLLPELGSDPLLPPLEEGQAARDPFDSQLVHTARRTRDGFEFRLLTR